MLETAASHQAKGDFSPETSIDLHLRDAMTDVIVKAAGAIVA
jgi:hypothetical protein